MKWSLARGSVDLQLKYRHRCLYIIIENRYIYGKGTVINYRDVLGKQLTVKIILYSDFHVRVVFLSKRASNNLYNLRKVFTKKKNERNTNPYEHISLFFWNSRIVLDKYFSFILHTEKETQRH